MFRGWLNKSLMLRRLLSEMRVWRHTFLQAGLDGALKAVVGSHRRVLPGGGNGSGFIGAFPGINNRS